MKVLETVLSFFLTLAQVIFPRKRKPSPSDRPCPPPQPLSLIHISEPTRRS